MTNLKITSQFDLFLTLVLLTLHLLTTVFLLYDFLTYTVPFLIINPHHLDLKGADHRHVLSPQLFNYIVSAAADLVLGRVPNTVRPSRFLRIECATHILVGGQKCYFRLFILAILKQI